MLTSQFINRTAFGLVCLALSSCGGLAGGGSTYHTPPKSIHVGQPTTLSMELKVWGAGSGKLSNRYTNIQCHYRIVGTDTYSVVPMTLTTETNDRLTVECVIPPLEAKAGDKLEYFIDHQFDHVYNRYNPKPVPFE
jgi:hypothetical protein